MTMKKSKVHFYSKIFFCIFFTILFLNSCSKEGNIQFCEGTDKENNPVKCGSVFTTGDLTIIINSAKAFNTEKITVKVYDTASEKPAPLKREFLTVEPTAKFARFDTNFINPGNYCFIAEKSDGEVVSKGTLKVIDDIEVE